MNITELVFSILSNRVLLSPSRYDHEPEILCQGAPRVCFLYPVQKTASARLRIPMPHKVVWWCIVVAKGTLGGVLREWPNDSPGRPFS